jgi:sigma-B regulation protein RsbU (phosphoserine phosphatase)
MFVTVFYGIYTISTGEITYCNAGHNPPYILKPDGSVEALPMPQDFLLGAIEGLEYHDNHMKLEPGETLVMFTDGVNEAMDIDFKEFGDDRFEESLKKCAGQDCQQIIDTVKADVAAFVGEAEQSDDITLFALKRK